MSMALGLFVTLLFVLGASCDDATPLSNISFPEGFSFGVATAAYQIEGGWNEDGKGEQLWDWFSHTYPEKIDGKALDGKEGDVACDSYHKWKEDIQLLADLGVNHYRFSLSWTRILPNGTIDNINQKGINYYTNILETLRTHNITPYVTLYHWDLPLAFHESGGWLNPRIADYFADYARLCFQKFGNYVKNWITINEPQTTCAQGYSEGGKAPDYHHTGDGVYQCAYTNVLAHAKAYHIYDEEFREKQGGRVSIVLDSAWAEPLNPDSEEDQEASKVALAFSIGLYANPIYNGDWPQLVKDRVDDRSKQEGFATSRLPKFTEEEIEYIKGTADFFGLNNYGAYYATPQNYTIGVPAYLSDIGISKTYNESWKTDVNWVRQVPSGFRKLINYAWNEFGQKQIIITENGWADDAHKHNLTLNDTARIDYIGQYLSALLEAYYEDNVDVAGYTCWSLMDNLEWTNGFSQKLGLVSVNFTSPNTTRTPKQSYTWYQKVLKTKCLVDSCENRTTPAPPTPTTETPKSTTASAQVVVASFMLLGIAVLTSLGRF